MSGIVPHFGYLYPDGQPHLPKASGSEPFAASKGMGYTAVWAWRTRELRPGAMPHVGWGDAWGTGAGTGATAALPRSSVNFC